MVIDRIYVAVTSYLLYHVLQGHEAPCSCLAGLGVLNLCFEIIKS